MTYDKELNDKLCELQIEFVKGLRTYILEHYKSNEEVERDYSTKEAIKDFTKTVCAPEIEEELTEKVKQRGYISKQEGYEKAIKCIPFVLQSGENVGKAFLQAEFGIEEK